MSENMTDDPEALAVKALGFIAADPAQLSRFLDVTGWTPQAIAEPGSRAPLLMAVLDYLMQSEDLLVTFAANAGVEPARIAETYRKLAGDTAVPGA